MIQVILVLIIMAMGIFLWLKNKQYNRNIEKRNRVATKQEELLQLLRKQNKEENNDN